MEERAGIVRRVDELRRISLPKDVLRRYKILEGEQVEIIMEEDQMIIRRFDPVPDYLKELRRLESTVQDDLDMELGLKKTLLGALKTMKDCFRAN